MKVILKKALKSGRIKTITGKLIQNGLSHITIAVTDNKGSQSIKRFEKADYIVTFYGASIL